MKEYIIQKASKTDIELILELIQKRIAWMDKNNISQWNKTNYLSCYPRSYFETLIATGQLYVVKASASDRPLGAVALLEEDKRWDDGAQSYYIHNLVSNTEFVGVGATIISFCEKLAVENRIPRIRLDCQAANHKLNEYYERLGYHHVGTVRDGGYTGNKREKILTL